MKPPKPPHLLRFEVLAWISVGVIFGVGLWQNPSHFGNAYFVGAVAMTGALITLLVYRYRRMLGARQQAETALDASHKRLEDLRWALDQSAIVAMTDVQGTITYVNDQFCQISKYSRDELIGQNHRLINSGLHPPEFFKEMYRTIAGGRVWRAEIRNRAKDGSIYWVDTTIVPAVGEDGRPYQYIAIRYDVTERKRSEATLRAQMALVQIGKMAAVVAHEVRNPLAGIRGAMQVLGGRVPAGSREHRVIAEVVGRIDALNDIVEDLLLFARPRPVVPAPVRINDLLGETVSLLRTDPRFQGITLRMDPTDASVMADADQLKLVVQNLLINGAQAMGGPGEIRVSTRIEGDRLEMRIIDQGPGILPEAREHLFEPFFTTKHRGTGLGLATTRRILEDHGGTIDLDCPPGGGTVAIIRLPVSGRRDGTGIA
jgi:PAS domain S-box-containing protein